jgi:hypothetical protein
MSPDQLPDLIRRVEEIEERLRTLENRVFGGSPYTPPVGPVGYTGPLAPATPPTRESPELDIDNLPPGPSHPKSVQVRAKPDKSQWWPMPVM